MEIYSVFNIMSKISLVPVLFLIIQCLSVPHRTNHPPTPPPPPPHRHHQPTPEDPCLACAENANCKVGK